MLLEFTCSFCHGVNCVTCYLSLSFKNTCSTLFLSLYSRDPANLTSLPTKPTRLPLLRLSLCPHPPLPLILSKRSCSFKLSNILTETWYVNGVDDHLKNLSQSSLNTLSSPTAVWRSSPYIDKMTPVFTNL